MQDAKNEISGYTGCKSAIDRCARPYSDERIQEIVEQFHRDGYYFFGPILAPAEIAALQAAMERKHADPALHADEEGDHIRGISLLRMFEYDRNFRDLVAREFDRGGGAALRRLRVVAAGGRREAGRREHLVELGLLRAEAVYLHVRVPQLRREHVVP